MSRASAHLLVLTVTLATATRSSAQPTAPWRDSARQLTVRIHALRDSLLESDSTVRELQRGETLVLRASAGLAETARESWNRLLQARSRWFGNEGPGAAGFRIVLRRDTRTYGWPPRPAKVETLVLAGLPDSAGAVRTQRNLADERFAEALVDLYGEIMFASAGPRLAAWVGVGAPISLEPEIRRRLARYALVTGMGGPQRRCVQGSLPDCATALSLRPESGGTFPTLVQIDLLLAALEAGGPGAWNRLRAAKDDDVGIGLSAAAGMPLDSLLGRWRARLLASRPQDPPLSVSLIALTLGWTLAGIAIAVGVSRWA